MASFSWLMRLERAIVHGTLDRPEVGDEVLIGESVMVVQYQKQGRCGCVPATVGIGQQWHPVVRLCPVHATASRELFGRSLDHLRGAPVAGP